MNYPYSTKKWIAMSLTVLMLASASSAFADSSAPAATTNAAATNTTTPNAATTNTATTTTPAPAAQPASAPAQAETLTLDKVVTQALQTNSNLQSLRIEVDKADTQARLVHDTYKGMSEDLIVGLSAAQSKYETQAQAQMGKILNSLSLKAAEEQVKLGAQKSFYDLLHAQAEVLLKKQSLTRAQTQLKVVKASFDVGTRAKTDVLQAEMGVAGAQAALVKAENDFQTSRMKLNQFIGVDLQKQWNLQNQNKQLQSVALTLDQATQQALTQRTEVEQRQQELKLAELKKKLIADYSSLATYQGQIAGANVDKANLAIDVQNRDIQLDVAEAYLNVNAAKQAVEFQQKAKESATENYRLTNLRFENGLATTLDVIQAEEQLSQQENNYQEAIRTYNLAVVNFETSLGNNKEGAK